MWSGVAVLSGFPLATVVRARRCAPLSVGGVTYVDTRRGRRRGSSRGPLLQAPRMPSAPSKRRTVPRRKKPPTAIRPVPSLTTPELLPSCVTSEPSALCLKSRYAGSCPVRRRIRPTPMSAMPKNSVSRLVWSWWVGSCPSETAVITEAPGACQTATARRKEAPHPARRLPLGGDPYDRAPVTWTFVPTPARCGGGRTRAPSERHAHAPAPPTGRARGHTRDRGSANNPHAHGCWRADRPTAPGCTCSVVRQGRKLCECCARR